MVMAMVLWILISVHMSISKCLTGACFAGLC